MAEHPINLTKASTLQLRMWTAADINSCSTLFLLLGQLALNNIVGTCWVATSLTLEFG